ncbi:MAG TPA: hypothetical protein VG013_29870 [Gemmataceae bacterium]|jgi:WD40 repeat protein|nr:hypothetical protein [Gemmataceae bacterium]
MSSARGFLFAIALLAFLVSHTARAKSPEPDKQAGRERPGPPRTDRYGDPLPERAVARFGTTRFRTGGHLASAAVSPDGRFLALAERTIRLLSARTGKEIRRLQDDRLGTPNLGFSPDGSMLAAVGSTGRIDLWEVATGKQVRQLNTVHTGLASFVFSANGKVLAAVNKGLLNNSVHAWDVATGTELGRFDPVQKYNIRLALSPDGTTLASAGQYVPREGNDRRQDTNQTVQLWDVATGKERRRLKVGTGSATATVFSPDGKTVITADGAAALSVWSVATGKQLRRFAGRRGIGASLDLSPDGKTLAAGTPDGTIQRWHTGTGRRRGLWRPPGKLRLSGFHFTRDGKALAWAIDGQCVVLWDVFSGKLLSREGGHRSAVRTLAFARDGNSVVSVGADGEACVWAVATGKETRRISLQDDESTRDGMPRSSEFALPPAMRRESSAFAISPDGRYVLAGGRFNVPLGLWELATGQEVCEFEARPRYEGIAAAFSPDGAVLAAEDMDWQTRTPAVRLWDVATGQELRRLKGWGGDLSCLAFSPDGKALATSNRVRPRGVGALLWEVRLWSVATGKELRVVNTTDSGVFALAFLPDGKTLALGEAGGAIVLWDASRGKEIRRFGGDGFVTAPLVFSPDGRALAVASFQHYGAESKVRLWEVASGTLRQEFSGHEGMVTALAFSPDGRALATGGSDTTVLMWDLAGGPRFARAATLSAKDLEGLWSALADTDGRAGFRAICRLAAAPRDAVPCLKQRLRAVWKAGPDSQEIDTLIAQLDDKKFEVREQATRELQSLGKAAAPALGKFLRGKASPEARRRAQQALNNLEAPGDSPEMLRVLRALEVLERIGTPEARQILETLSKGRPTARETQEAKASLERLDKRPTSRPR